MNRIRRWLSRFCSHPGLIRQDVGADIWVTSWHCVRCGQYRSPGETWSVRS